MFEKITRNTRLFYESYFKSFAKYTVYTAPIALGFCVLIAALEQKSEKDAMLLKDETKRAKAEEFNELMRTFFEDEDTE